MENQSTIVSTVRHVLVAGQWFTTLRASLAYDPIQRQYHPPLFIPAIGNGGNPVLIPTEKVDAFTLDEESGWRLLKAAAAPATP